MTQSFLDRAIEHARSLLPAVEGNAARLPEPMRTLVIVSAAQGIIDNGGLEYFFEADFPANPPYVLFVDAYRRIGAEAVSRCIELSAAMFPFPDPHLHAEPRQQWLESIRGNEAHEFTRLSIKACGDQGVYQKLDEFVDRNRDALRP